MEKINGYTKEEAEELVRYISEGKRAGKTLTSLFAGYGRQHGRAGGSVRNYYYKLLKTQSAGARALLEGKQLCAAAAVPFSEEEKGEMLRLILTERGKGCSVRRAISNVCGGDAKKMLRYQNKYRNMLKKQPEEVRAAAKRCGAKLPRPSAFLERRLEKEIDALYGRLAASLREENEQLREAVRRLTEENDLLRRASRVKKAMLTVAGGTDAAKGRGGA